METKQHSLSDYHLGSRHSKRKQLFCQKMHEDVRESVSITKNSFRKANFLKRRTNDETHQGATPVDHLVKIELDAALALAEFSRLVCLPFQLSEGDSFDLHWFRKKKRSKRSSKEATCYKLDKVSFLSSGKHKLKATEVHRNAKCNSHINVQKCKEFIDKTTEKLGSALAGENNGHKNRLTLELSKESVPSGSGSESPSSPLPSQLECTLVQSRRVSAFQRVLLPVHSAFKAATVPVNQKARAEESSLDLCLLVEERKHMLAKRPGSSLTEMEKEVRRLQRVHANRESARKTVRRKQILCEELAKKAARLRTENDRMMQEKEFLLQEFCALSQRNQNLKQLLQSNCDSSKSLPKLNVVPLQQARSPPQQTLDMESEKSLNPEVRCNMMTPGLLEEINEKKEQNTQHIISSTGNLVALGAKPANLLAEGDPSTEHEKDAVHDTRSTGPILKDAEKAEVSSVHMEAAGSEDALVKVSSCQNLPITMGYQTMSFLMTPSLHSKVVGKELQEYQTSHFHMQNPVSATVSTGSDCCGKISKLSRMKWPQHLFGAIDDESECSNMHIRQKIAAAAEARRRRKELTRSKVLRFRQVRLPS